jgi:hypothetical protein
MKQCVYITAPSVASAPGGGEWPAPSPGTSPTACLEAVKKIKSLPLQTLEPRFLGHPAGSPSLFRLRYTGSDIFIDFGILSTLNCFMP